MTEVLITNLKNKARYWAGEITKRAKSYAPAHIRDAISSHVEDVSEGRIIIRTVADGRKHKDVRAWEYGSGIHAKKGAKKRYPIRPKPGKKFLAFNWEVANANPESFTFVKDVGGSPSDNRVLLPQVMHPGIQAANNGQGYIGPVQREIRPKLKEAIKEATGDAIRTSLRKSFEKIK